MILTKKSASLLGKLKFKGLKHFDTPDGLAYTCDVYYEKKPIVRVVNEGQGGETNLDFFPGGEELFESLDVVSYYDESKYPFKLDMRFIISDLVELNIEFEKVRKNRQTNSIIFVPPGDISNDFPVNQLKYSYSLAKIAKAGRGKTIRDKVTQLEEEGSLILNTNLSKLGI